jgi:uncharacterized protein
MAGVQDLNYWRGVLTTLYIRGGREVCWDERKNRANVAKHGVGFEVAKRVFDDPLHVSSPDRHEHGEERWRTVGLVRSTLLLLVVNAYVEQNGEECIRLISARKATPTERRRYEEGS